MTEITEEKRLESLFNASAVLAILIASFQAVFFVLDGWRIYNIAAIYVSLANVFFAVRYLKQSNTETLWRMFVCYVGQFVFFVVKLMDREPSTVPGLFVILVLLMHTLIVLCILIGARRLIRNPKLFLLPVLLVTSLFFLEASLHSLSSPTVATKKLEQPEWVGGAIEYRQDVGLIYRPNSELQSYYPNNPRGYFKDVNSSSKKWWLRVASGGEANLVFPETSGSVRIDIKKTAAGKATDIQLNMPHFKAKKKVRYRAEFRARADRPRSAFVGFAKSHEPWDGLGLYQQINLTPDWQFFQTPFVATANDKNARILFDVGESDIPVEFSTAYLFNVRKKKILDPEIPSQKAFVSYRFNSTGCRGPDYAMPKPAGKRRVLILGNGYALGVGVHEEDTLAHQMEELLNQYNSEYEVIHCGIEGYTTQQQRMFYESYASKYDPDVVLILMTAEDQIADMKPFPLKQNLFLSWNRLFDGEKDRVPSFARSVSEILQLNAEVRQQGGQTAVVFFRINGDKDGSTDSGRTWNDLVRTVTNGLHSSDVAILDLQKLCIRNTLTKIWWCIL